MNDPIQTLHRDLTGLGFHPNRLRGQNFLISSKVRAKIITHSELTESDTVVEIGPGTGILTYQLIPQVKNLILLEIDDALYQFLQVKTSIFQNVSLVHCDALQWLRVYLPGLDPGYKVKVVSNLPYCISSPILTLLAEYSDKIDGVVLVLQDEVAFRVAAEPGTKERGILSAVIQSRFNVKVITWVDRMKFWPQPEVKSAVVALRPNQKLHPVEFRLIKQMSCVLFAHRRKTVLNNLRHAFPECDVRFCLDKLGIPHNHRPEQLTSDQIHAIAIRFEDALLKDTSEETENLPLSDSN
jgi:16S rRNA (adenine1518-N6/adenine1519-N6)-dimethyltransferase